ncbi:MAG: twin-arginine translocase TatA/TatE family subunit [Crocinitomicaceae bacterium]|nr:twin-arginine translocase TatA/TatE family subunit [Crocinitomicaceae bacterium]
MGGFEILLILGFILVFFGSKSIPGLARTFGKTIRQIKEASADIKTEIKKSANEMKGDLDLKGLISESAEDVRRPLDQYAQDIDNAVKYTPPRKTTVVADEVNESEENLEMDETPILEEPKVEVSNIKAKKPKAGQSDSDLLDFPSEEEY